MSVVQAENKKLVEPLRKAKEELHRLKGISEWKINCSSDPYLYIDYNYIKKSYEYIKAHPKQLKYSFM